MAAYILSANACHSLREIKAYSTAKFGEQQTILYLQKLRDRMRFLAENPASGKARDEINSGYFNYFEESHTIYYTILPNGIVIIDVLPQSMEPTRHLKIKGGEPNTLRSVISQSPQTLNRSFDNCRVCAPPAFIV